MDVLDRRLDVICQHTSEGRVIPIKIRMIDDDGEWQIYKIKSYKVLASPGTVHLPNNVDTTTNTWLCECQVFIFNRTLMIKLYYNVYEGVWKLVNG